MAFNGSGVYVRVRNWATDKLNSLNPTATRFDEHDDDVANALSNTICKDGQSSPTANISLNSHKITNLADATIGTDALNRQTGDGRYAQLAATLTLTGTPLLLSNTSPALDFNETDAAADNRRWRWVAAGEAFFGSIFNDALSLSTNWLVVNRTSQTVDSISLLATAVLVNGVSINDAAILTTGTLPNGRFPATLPTISGVNITGLTQAQVAPLTGSFTGTLTGYSANPTGTVFYSIAAGFCTLYITAAISATSTSTSMTMTGLPAACQPTVAQAGLMEATNGGVVNSLARFLTGAGSGTITFTANIAGDLAAGFGGAGTKGLPAGWNIRYKL